MAKEAKDIGLVPIPNSSKTLFKLIDNPENKITNAEIVYPQLTASTATAPRSDMN